MATLEELRQQETFLRQKLEGTKSIDERRKLRAELRTLREKKEKFVDDNNNNNNNQSSTVASKVTMTVGSTRKNEFQEKTNRLNRDSSPARKENVAPQKPKSTRSTFSFKMANADEASPERPSTESYSRRHQTNHVKSNIEEKRPRRNPDVNHNRDQLNITKGRNEPIREKKQEPETASPTPQRMSRRASLAELFKIDQDSGSKPQVDGRPTAAPVPQVQVSPSPPTQRRMPPETPQDMKTKQDLLQNLGRLRCRRRSVREIERKEELEGLMYVKSGDSVKLVSTSEGDEQAKEQRRMRRSSRKESHDRLKIEGNTISERGETELTAIDESPRLPTAARNFGFGSVNKSPAQNRYGSSAKRDEPTTVNRTWPPVPAKDQGNGGTGRVTKQWPPPSDPAPERAQPPKPTSFLPQKNDGPKFGRFGDKSGGGGMGSVKDRMAFFRAAAEEEKKAKEKQHVQKRPTAPVNQFNGPAPISRTAPTSQTGPAGQTGPTSPTSPTSPKERVSLKKAPDRNKTPRELKKKPPLKRQMSVSSLILEWCKDVTKEYENVNITNFSGSFSNGLAFCALIHKFNPDKFDYNSLSKENREHNFKLAFETGSSVGIPALLDVEDMIRLSKPEPRSVQCYVQMIFSKYRPKDIDMSNLIIA